MSTLADWVVVFARSEKGCLWIDVPLVEDGMDGDGEEIAERGDQGGIGVKDGFTGGVAGHCRM